MKVIIVGCGRVGTELALSLQHEHVVTVIDPDSRSFDRLGLRFTGRTVQGEGMDRNVLIRAGIESADALAAVTASDNVNLIVARIANEVFHVKRVATRVYNPRRLALYEKLNLQTVASSSWGARRIEQLLVHPALQSIVSPGNGDVQIYEMSIPQEWAGHSVSELVPAEGAIAVSLTRGASSMLPRPELTLQAEDILQVSASADGLAILRQRLHDNGFSIAFQNQAERITT